MRSHTALQPLALRYAAMHCTAPTEIGVMSEADSMSVPVVRHKLKYRMAGCGCEWKAEPRLGATR